MKQNRQLLYGMQWVIALFVGIALLCGCGGGISDSGFVKDTLPESELVLEDLLPHYADPEELDSLKWVELERNRGPFISDRDTNQYKQCLYRLKQLVENDADVPAKVLCDAVPRSEEEFLIHYRLTECTWTVETEKGRYSLIDLNNMLWRYSVADSTGVMEAYLLYGEFVDGYIAEGAFDNYIALEEALPAKFAKLRKARSGYWNEMYEEWKKAWAEYFEESSEPSFSQFGNGVHKVYRNLSDTEIGTLDFDGYQMDSFHKVLLDSWKEEAKEHRPYYSIATCQSCQHHLLVVYGKTPQETWESLCGRAGNLAICTHCRKVLDFELVVMN